MSHILTKLILNLPLVHYNLINFVLNLPCGRNNFISPFGLGERNSLQKITCKMCIRISTYKIICVNIYYNPQNTKN